MSWKLRRKERYRIKTVFKKIKEIITATDSEEIKEYLEAALYDVVEAFNVRVKNGRLNNVTEARVLNLLILGKKTTHKEIAFKCKLSRSCVNRIARKHKMRRYRARVKMKEAA